ncbi:glycosyltransferase family 4 protein [Endozoicomonas sp. ONNA2]|uniref:glycosyltransferase family 4 protein n=1 Tax=Endozoicomonas sp. ONNA2 TaxID=2828741 RepID=UPI0021475F3B|nr:glycosyltransferase family 4 protein [Endozoicomonas sp. ONNA2]
MRKVLLVGTLPPPYHGQSIAFKSIVDDIDCDKEIVMTSFRSDNVLLSVLYFFKYLFQVLYSLFIFKPTHVYFLCSRSFFGSLRDVYLLYLLRFSKAVVVNHLHGADFKSFYESRSFVYRAILKFTYSRVDKHIVLHDSMKEQVSCVSSLKKIYVVENFYESVADTVSLRNIKFYFDGKVSAIYLSSIMLSKGIFETIESVKIIREKGYDINLCIYGDFTSDSEMTKSEVKDLFFSAIQGCENFISYNGVVTGLEKYTILSEFDVFVLPTYYSCEAFPLSIIEAMRMGCVIITSDFNYLSKIVESDNGYIVKPKNSASLASVFEKIFNHPSAVRDIKINNFKSSKVRFTERRFRDLVKSNIFG